MHKFDLKGKKVLITGAGTGIGRAVAIEFAKLGADIVVNYNASRETAEEVVNEIHKLGSQAISVQADVTQEEQAKRLVEEAAKFGNGEINILVNNAGTLVQRCKIDEMDLSLWNKVMDVNLTTAFLVTKHVIPYMKKQNSGRIINLSSLAAHDGGGPGAIPYATSKAAVQAFTKGLAKELAPYNVLVNCLAPGLITTRFHDQYNTPENRAKTCQNIPLKREGSPEEVAGAAVLLSTEYGSYITGETIEVNGGVLMD
ncbi:3-oxoacyl-[acyl-carrier protein] reductase [Desulfotomaculum arcticum]|uniref:3-oxoacyl-[acyl-carrier protein] reductase n=1 Tax=Desulfotruncus arcticus DSM 17038 TaxID=1121424 RepID=A0A1I2YGE2_9FIRM|nr:3-oxoacyl-ACP reductase family protein [Desulfotruncus arcticus]SFH24497.1 3-oxoacyl-[acyl-carrier protein] reductase [Desulfotomaculum arcticum] [Desulfotruncus arcticus DSM 17038]